MSALLHALDWWAATHLHGGHAPRALLWGMVAMTAVGSGWSLCALIPFLYRSTTRRAAAMLLLAIVLSASVVFVVKKCVGRIRPCACVSGVAALVFEAPRDPSFPSGHAAGAFTVAGFLTMARRGRRTSKSRVEWESLGLWAAAIAIGLSRVFLGVHFLTDVVIGAVLGSGIGLAVGLRSSPAIDETPTGISGRGAAPRRR